MILETFRRAGAPDQTRVIMDADGATHMAIGAAGQLAALVEEGRARPPCERWSEWGCMKSADVGIVSALAMFIRLPETIKPGGVVIVQGLTIIHHDNAEAARASIMAEA